jgi:capsular exopolysaccharide synthesis family protein
MSNHDGEFEQLPMRAPKVPAGPPVRPFAPEMPASGGVKRDYAGLLEYWQMVRRHQLAVIVLVVLGAVVGYLQTLPEPRMYQARTTLEIQGLNQDFLNLKNVTPTMTPTSADYPQFDIETQVKILQSRAILRRTTGKLEEHKDTAGLQPPDRLSAWRKALHLPAPTPEQLWQQAVGTAAGNLRVRSSGTNRIVEVTCSSTNPRIAAAFVNTLAQEYIEENLEARWKTTEYTGQWLTKQLQDLKIKLEKAEDELQGYARSTGLVITDEKTNVDESKLADLQKELSEARADRMTKQSKWELLANSPPDALPQVLDDPELQSSRTKLAELRQQIAQLRITYTPNHPEVQKIAAQIKTIEDGFEKQRTNILARIRNEYQGAKRREDMLAAAYGSQSRRVSDEAEKTTHYNLLKREVDTNRTLYETMLQTLKEASISSALRASNIRIVDVAEAPGGPYLPDTSRSLTVGILTGLFLGIGFSVLRERADRTLQDPGDPTFYLKLPELGVIPASVLELPQTATASPLKMIDVKPLRNGHGNGNGNGNGNGSPAVKTREPELLNDSLELVSWNRKSSLLAESFRTTLTSILFSGQDGNHPRVLVLTSASPKEGKSTITSNLGIAAADIKRRVLLIDADLRRPRLHKVFNLDNKYGLSDLLHESEPLDAASMFKAVYTTDIPRLSVMASGASRHSVSSLLYSDRLPELLRLARNEFDMVIIDTPPMVNISDARVLARLGDALILVVRSGVTTRDAALLAKQRFTDDGVNVLGIILNGWNPKTPGYGYYRYYYAGYYHYYGKTTADKEA